jgi:hypothetical protein
MPNRLIASVMAVSASGASTWPITAAGVPLRRTIAQGVELLLLLLDHGRHNTFGRSGHKSQRSCIWCALTFGQSPLIRLWIITMCRVIRCRANIASNFMQRLLGGRLGRGCKVRCVALTNHRGDRTMQIPFAALALALLAMPALAASPKVEAAIKTLRAVAADSN